MRELAYNAKVCGNTIYTYSFYTNYTNIIAEKAISLDDWDIPASRSSEYFGKIALYREYTSKCDKKALLDYEYYLSLGLDDSIARALGNSFYRFGPELYGLYNINDSALTRSRRRLRDLVYTNYTSTSNGRFLTLTYKNAQFSSAQLKSDFNLFIKRLKYKTKNNDIRYIAIPEKHQSAETAPDRFGSYHLHILLFDTGYIDSWELADIWGHGSIDIIKLYGDPSGVAFYVTKYLTKDMGVHNECNRTTTTPPYTTGILICAVLLD